MDNVAAPPIDTLTRLKAGLGQLLRGKTVAKIWGHIKKNNLQNPANKREILADAKLKLVSDGADEVSMFEMNKRLAKHLKQAARKIPWSNASGRPARIA